MAHTQTILFEWLSPEYVKNERTTDWYWATAILGIVGCIASIYFNNTLFGVIVCISTILVIAYAAKPVDNNSVALSATGISVNEKFTPWEHVHTFWIENHPREGYKLLIHSDTRVIIISVIPIDSEKIDITELRNFLTSVSKEQEMFEPISTRVFEAIF